MNCWKITFVALAIFFAAILFGCTEKSSSEKEKAPSSESKSTKTEKAPSSESSSTKTEKEKAPNSESNSTKTTQVDTRLTDVYRAYLNAIKNDDFAAAKDCWWVSGEDKSGALNVIAGLWVGHHRFVKAMKSLGIDEKQLGDRLIRDDCKDAAIDRTLARLPNSKQVIEGNIGALKIVWEKDDGYPVSVFAYSDDPIVFRKVNDEWKMDACFMCGIKKPSDFFRGSWGRSMQNELKVLNIISSKVENKKLKSIDEVITELERHRGSLEGVIPYTRKVIFQRDTPKQYIRITKGNPRIVAMGGQQLPHRPDIKHPRRVEGNLKCIFEEIHGIDRPKIVVETSNRKGYEVIYDPDDQTALKVVAEKLGLEVGEEMREIRALVLSIDPQGHQLKKCPKPAKPQWDIAIEGDKWPLHGVTMDELTQFLESRYRRPVVNQTGLSGYYTFELSNDSVKQWPQRRGKFQKLDDTGLRIRWEKVKTKVLVVKDK